ncbi:MAG: hypothetical protein WBA23_16345 [Tunicatimonas sp.]
MGDSFGFRQGKNVDEAALRRPASQRDFLTGRRSAQYETENDRIKQ